MLGDAESAPQHKPNMSRSLSRYSKYLKSYYSKYSVARDDKLSIAPSSQFINLALVKKDSSCHDRFSKSTFHGGVDEIVASKTPLAMDALVTADSRFVLVEGPPGIGKSTLCWELCRQWESFPSLQRYKIVLQLKLRERRVQNSVKLSEIFLHDDEELSQKVVKEVLECEGEGVLLILDGFDEMPTSIVKDDHSMIMRLISGKCLPKATRLVSSRPSALHHKSIFPDDHRHVEILGFTDERKVEFAESAFQREPDVLVHFKTFIFSNPIIKSLMYIPVNCAIIAQVYKDIRRSRAPMPKTMTQLYTTLVLVLIRRHLIEKGVWPEDAGLPTDLASLPGDINPDLKRVNKLAYRGLFERVGQLVFSESDVGEGFQHLGLLCVSKEMYVCEGAKSSYAFPHKSVQEFLSAWHISCNSSLLTSFDGFFSILPGLERLNEFSKFLVGLVGCSKFPFDSMKCKREDESEDESNAVLMVHCLYEAQDSCKSLESHQFPDILEYESKTPLDVYVFGYVLVHAPIQWNLVLAGYSDMSQLVNSCKESSEVLGRISTLAKYDPQASFSLSEFEKLP